MLMLVLVHIYRRIDLPFAVIYNHGKANRRRASRRVEYILRLSALSLTTEWPRHVDVYDHLLYTYPLYIPSFVHWYMAIRKATHSESLTVCSHASTLIPVLSRPVASLGHPVLQMTLRGLPRLLHLFFVSCLSLRPPPHPSFSLSLSHSQPTSSLSLIPSGFSLPNGVRWYRNSEFTSVRIYLFSLIILTVNPTKRRFNWIVRTVKR